MPRPRSHPETEQVRPLRPPYLASETGARMDGPVEPWAESLKTLMLVFGVLLVACFVAPWSVTEGGTGFSWSVLKGEGPLSVKLVPIFFAATGVLAVVLGALPLGMVARGIAAAAVSLGPLIYLTIGGQFVWQQLVAVLGLAALLSGLLLRSHYRGSLLARILVTVGVIAVLVPFLVPFGLIDAFKAIGTAPGKAKLTAILELVPILVALLSLLVWLPASTAAGATIFAWILIVWPMVASIAALLVGGNIGATIKAGLMTVFYLPLAMVAWQAIGAHGVASVLGKKLEHAS